MDVQGIIINYLRTPFALCLFPSRFCPDGPKMITIKNIAQLKIYTIAVNESLNLSVSLS